MKVQEFIDETTIEVTDSGHPIIPKNELLQNISRIGNNDVKNENIDNIITKSQLNSKIGEIVLNVICSSKVTKSLYAMLMKFMVVKCCIVNCLAFSEPIVSFPY